MVILKMWYNRSAATLFEMGTDAWCGSNGCEFIERWSTVTENFPGATPVIVPTIPRKVVPVKQSPFVLPSGLPRKEFTAGDADF